MTDEWIGAAASARGARHVRRDEPSEDSFKVGIDTGRAIALVADGHGSERCTRADIGARLAVDVGFASLAESTSQNLDQLPAQIVDRWRSRVDDHLQANPPSPQEAEGAPAPHYLLYGTTLLGAVIDSSALRIVQFGDGDALLGHRGTTRARRPIPPKEVDRPHETDSLSQDDAADRAYVIEYDLEAISADVVMLASDGLDTAFAEPEWHDETMADVLARVEGLAARELEDVIASWCKPPAEVGGDDTTIALLVRRS